MPKPLVAAVFQSLALLCFCGSGWAQDIDYTGIWRFSSTNYYTNCGAAPADHVSIAEVTQRGDHLVSYAEGNTYEGNVSGRTGTMTRSYYDEGGITEETITVTLDETGNTGSGNLYWIWYDNDYYCEGISDINIQRVTGAPNRNITGMWQYATSNTWSENCASGNTETGITAVRQNGTAFTYIDQYGIHTGRASGDDYFCTISYYDSGGVTTQTVYFTMVSSTHAAGTLVWKWSDGYSQCLGGSDLNLVKSTSPPAYDASGRWDFQSTNPWKSQTGCPGPPPDGKASITQDGIDFRLAGYNDVQSGFLTDDVYLGFLSYPALNGTVTEVLAFGLSTGGQATGSGFAIRKWTDGTNECYSGNDFAMSKSAGANDRPSAPDPVSPADAAEGVSTTPTLTAGSFADPDEGDVHWLSEWQLSTSNSFQSTVFETVTEANLTALTVPRFALKGGTTYHWRVRYYDIQKTASPWSSARSFQTAPSADDLNGDGIPDDQAVGAQVDADGNGIADVIQNDIRSVNTVLGTGALGVSRTNTTGVLSINAVESIDPDSISAITRPYGMDHGVVAVNMTVFKPVDAAVLTIHLPQAAPDGAGWFAYDPVNGWVDYTDFATFSSDRRRIQVRLKDWGYGDADGTANGDVVDPGGIGFISYLKGAVTDAVSQAIINGARIRLTTGAQHAELKTVANGVYLAPIVPGSYAITVSALGYRDAILPTVTVGNVETKTLNVSLTPFLCDLNDNGSTDLADAIICLKALSGAPGFPVSFNSSADVDEDNRLGLEELIFILQSLSQLRN